jgi:hypothetical protein
VRIQQHGRRVVGRRDLADDHRRRVRKVERDQLDDSCVMTHVDDGLVGLQQRRTRLLREPRRRDRRDRNEAGQIVAQLRQNRRNA